jgi:hypothetical protein
MRWWLALAFALIASLTALVVAKVFSERAEGAFRGRAEEFTTGAAVAAASEIARAANEGNLEPVLGDVAERRRLALFVVGDDGRLLTPPRSRGVELGSVDLAEQAREEALADHRFVGSTNDGRTIVVGLPLSTTDAAALVAVASRPDLVAELSILRSRIVEAALLAVLSGALLGLLIAVLITARLRRIGRAASRIEGGRRPCPRSAPRPSRGPGRAPRRAWPARAP